MDFNRRADDGLGQPIQLGTWLDPSFTPLCVLCPAAHILPVGTQADSVAVFRIYVVIEGHVIVELKAIERLRGETGRRLKRRRR
jgi:hypothetical protein